MLAKGFSVPDLQHPALPGAVSWLPLPVGWYGLALVVVLAGLAYALLRLARWQRNRWRREARALLADTQRADDWIALIKRIQLVHQPRSHISASLRPATLLAGMPLDEELSQILCQRYCQPDNLLEVALNQRLSRQLTAWLEGLPDV